MTVHVFNPLADSRWDDFVRDHPQASAFHQRGWLEALARTYDYEPLVLTSAPPWQPLSNGIVFCRVSSWLTGSRLVSLPFADHCQPLVRNQDEIEEFTQWLRTECDRQQWKYIELRPLNAQGTISVIPADRAFYFHELDLNPSVGQLFERLHKDSIQRKVRRAEREGLTCEAGSSSSLKAAFYSLLLTTRRRHKLLPQPRIWFKNLCECMGDTLRIRVARKGSMPIAAIMTLQHRSTIIYKYGCSDERFHNLGGIPFLFWKLIEESKATGAEVIDFGRSDLDQPSLITFKDKFGASKRLLTYCRYANLQVKKGVSPLNWRGVRHVFSILPNMALAAGGRLLYRHMG